LDRILVATGTGRGMVDDEERVVTIVVRPQTDAVRLERDVGIRGEIDRLSRLRIEVVAEDGTRHGFAGSAGPPITGGNERDAGARMEGDVFRPDGPLNQPAVAREVRRDSLERSRQPECSHDEADDRQDDHGEADDDYTPAHFTSRRRFTKLR